MLTVQIGGGGLGQIANVTPSGELAISNLHHDETKFVELAVDDVAYNFYEPKPGKQFVITGIRAKADRDVSPTVDANVVVYEAESIDATTVSKILYQEAMVKGESVTLLPIHILVNAAVWLNAKTTDDDIHMTIMGYYVDEIG